MNTSISLGKIAGWILRSPDAVNRDIDEEFNFHIECRTQELINSGMAPDVARTEANRLFGDRHRIRKACQLVNYGRAFWLTASLGLCFLISVCVILCLTGLLRRANAENRDMMGRLASLQPVQDASKDLVGLVTDTKGQPIPGAKVLLIFKSWPGGNYQQDNLQQTTDDKGRFVFPELYSSDMQTAFLVTVLAEGRTMQSEYVLYKPRAKVKSFRFQLSTAMEKTFVLKSADGAPLADVDVYPASRKPKKGRKEFLTYYQSAADAGYRTDSEGKVRMALFEDGDSIVLTTANDSASLSATLKIDSSPEQAVTLTAAVEK